MGAPSQRAVRRPVRRSGGAIGRPQDPTFNEVDDTAGSSAGNAALADAFQQRRRRIQRASDRRETVDADTALEVPSTSDPRDMAAPLRLQRPVIAIGLDGTPFRRLARVRGSSNARSVAAALAGRDGTTAADFTAGVRSHAKDDNAGFSVDRHTATVRGRLDDFRAVRLLPADGPMSTGRREALDAIAPATTTVHQAGLRIRIDNIDLTRGRTGATVRVDGAGHLDVRFPFPGGTLRMMGTGRPGDVDDIDWTYLLEMDLLPFGAVIWRTMPRKRRFSVALYASGAAMPPGDDDDQAPRQAPHRDDQTPRHDDQTPRHDGLRHEDQAPQRNDQQDAAPHQDVTDQNVGAHAQAPNLERKDHRAVSPADHPSAMATGTDGSMTAEQRHIPKQDDPAGGVVDAVRSYLHGLEIDGTDHPATIERLGALRASLATHDKQAPQPEFSETGADHMDPSAVPGSDTVAESIPVADPDASDA